MQSVYIAALLETQNSPGFQVVSDIHLTIHYLVKNCLQIETDICNTEHVKNYDSADL